MSDTDLTQPIYAQTPPGEFRRLVDEISARTEALTMLYETCHSAHLEVANRLNAINARSNPEEPEPIDPIGLKETQPNV